MFLPRQIDNRQILWSALLMVLLDLVVFGALGIRPPQWFATSQKTELTQSPAKELIQDTASDRSPIQMRQTPNKTLTAPLVTETTVAGPDIDLNHFPEQSSELANSDIFIVPANFARQIPTVHLELSGEAQKHSFINFMLPLIVASNDELLQRRDAVEAAAAAKDRVMLEKLAVLYRVESEKIDNSKLADLLLRRVDSIPVALALAQAAVESGWGTSRFATQGNALFGQWAWRKSAGIRPLAASNKRAVVRSFGSLLESVRAYMHNLNTHPNYRGFRDARQRLKQQNESIKVKKLVTYLDSYAAIGTEYVDKLRAIISSNNFNKYAHAKLG